jgi:thiol-disulfide isomerase/thioredoxin
VEPGEPSSGRRKRRLAVAAVVAGGVAILVLVAVMAAGSSGGGGGGVTEPAAFDLPGIGGSGRLRLSDFAGRPLVVNFFASWCSACDDELPGFAKVSMELKGRVSFAGVDSLETGDPLYMPRRHGITWWPLARDIGGANRSGLHDALGGGTGMPLTAFYDGSGRLLYVARGGLPESSLRSKLAELYGV